MARSNSLQIVLDRQKASLPEQGGRPETTRQKASSSIEQRAASRHGLHLIGGHFPSEVVKQLRILAAEEETTIQNLLGEAIDDLFVKKGKSRLLPV
jgi:hypothetical protein